MHRLFREQLDDAVGTSEFVLALNIDIRGFTDWSLQVDSAQTVLYIKKIYARLIDDFFKEASFVKPTGDGLLVVKAFKESEVKETAVKAVKDSIQIVETFHALCEGDEMINFPVPKDVGIGIARGTASKLASRDRTLDYSGRVLNLASRLMDLARPRGVVLDESFGLNLLPKEISDQFHEDTAILKGISPRELVPLHCWPDEVKIPEWNKIPVGEERWEHREFTHTLKRLEDFSFTHYRTELSPPPLPDTPVECEVAFPEVTPSGHKGSGQRFYKVPLRIQEARGAKFAEFELKALIDRLKSKGVKSTWKVNLKISYRTA
jgi:class 3 adenylate cyclase